MTKEEASEVIKTMPLGTLLEVIKTNGDIVQVRLADYDVSGIAKKVYDGLEVPEQPPAIIVTGGTRFGKYRLDVQDIVKIARIG